MKRIKIVICIMLSIVILFSGSTFPVWAEENTNMQTTEALTLSVEYPSDIKCGVPVTFTMNATGGTGNYKYRIAALMDSELKSVYDISFGSNGAYVDSNTFTFTFYASGTYYIRFSVMDMTTYQTKMTGLYEYPIVIQDESYPSVEQIVTTVAAQCEAECSTDFEKALWLHDWIIDHADYDHSYSYCSAEGVLARGEGTCESYHEAYVKLLNKVGIQTGRMEGNVHVWTAVKMDGEWYHVDSTWDDMGASYKDTYYEHMYFGLTDDIISLVHDEHTAAIPGYEATALEDNYFIKTGQITRWSDAFVDTIKQNIAAGQTEFILPISDSMPDSYKNVIYNLVAYQLSKEDWNNTKLSVSYADSQLICKVVKEEGGDETPPETKPAGLTVYKGIDYSSVYDFDYYMNRYSDLKTAYSNDEAGALEHFVTYGMSEGRQGNDEFDVQTYRNRYADLRIGYRNDLKGYYMHYIQAGKAEGRSGAGTEKLVPITVYQGVDYAAVYNYDYYMGKYSDLKQAFGNDDYGALQHFIEHGMSEGRQGSEEFNVYTYKNRYADLRRGYKDDLRGYYMHYVNNGKAEGRSGAGDATLAGETIYQGVDYSAIYNYNYYISKYPDLKTGYGNDDAAVLQHFVENGMAEGRQGSAEFNVFAYMSRYDDLQAGYGNDWKGYYLHYLYNGKREGRDGSDLKESEYAAVYNYEMYLTLNPDLQSGYGNDRNAVLQHFVGHGMSEGRQASDEFNVYAYMNRYVDLKTGYGNNLKGYYLHYMNNGKTEGRNARVEEEVMSLSLEPLLKEEAELETLTKSESTTESEVVMEGETEPENETVPESEVVPAGETETEVALDEVSEGENDSQVETETKME